MREIKTFSVEETANLGYRLCQKLHGGALILLDGDLGAGKTAFTMGVAKALGIEGYITSPTFTLVNEYFGNRKLNHFDVYRIEEPEELFDIGFEEYMDDDAIVVIEWSKNIQEILPEDNISIEIKKDLSQGLDCRVITIEFNGDKYKDVESCLFNE